MEKAVNFTKMTYLKQSLLENSYQFFLATANICKTKRIRDLKIVLMEIAS